MSEIPFPKVLLNPCNHKQQNLSLALSSRVFPEDMKGIFCNHIDRYYVLHRPDFPTTPKEFYVIPYKGMKETLSRYGLQPPNFAALWLPSLAHEVYEIRNKLLEDSREITIIAFDYHFSSLKLLFLDKVIY